MGKEVVVSLWHFIQLLSVLGGLSYSFNQSILFFFFLTEAYI